VASGDRPAYRFLEEAEADFLEGLRLATAMSLADSISSSSAPWL